jgi:hypothetical protein
MRGQSIGSFWQRWIGDESTGRRRSLVAVPVLMIGLLIWVALMEWTSADGFALLFAALVIVGIGIFARSWLVLLTAYVAAILMFWTVELGIFLWLGAHEWEHRNAEHWQGSEPAYEKLIGQLMEYAVFGLVFMLPLVALGVVIGRGIEHSRRDRHDRRLEHSGV